MTEAIVLPTTLTVPPGSPVLAAGPVPQQPVWPDADQADRVRRILRSRPALVGADDVARLRTLVGRVARGEALVVQAGDCAEDPDESTAVEVRRKTEVLDRLAAGLERRTGLPVLRVGRIAGQFAKPRSSPIEVVDGVELPSYRGHFVNDPAPDAQARRPDPLRMLTCFMAANETVMHLGWRGGSRRHDGGLHDPAVWTSHDAMLVDYEYSLVRERAGHRWLGSTHWPWIGERTRQPDGAHVALLADVANPVAVKIGPGTSPDEIRALAATLDPGRSPGRLTFISRMGVGPVRAVLPALARAVHDGGHPAVWLCDPMHGNTRTHPGGRKYRVVTDLTDELLGFLEAVRGVGAVAGGVHLETSPESVTECVATDDLRDEVLRDYRTFCDPRLNPDQADAVVGAWTP